MSNRKFSLGQIVATPGALRTLKESGQEASFFLLKHVKGDWGNVSEEDAKTNDESITSGDRILSSYTTLKNKDVWIITEADRSVTTILLPEEY